MTTASIQGVATYHPRAEWEEVGYRMALDFTQEPPAQNLSLITTPVCHYTAAVNLPDGDPGEKWQDIIQKLRNTQRDYLTNRKSGAGYTRKSDGRHFPGYSVGYLFAVDWLGGVWELRGFDYRSGANVNDNSWTAPILFITDGADPGTDLQWAAARAVWREFKRRSGRSDFVNRPLGHDELPHGNTSCPGAGLLNQLHTGFGDLDRDNNLPNIPTQGGTLIPLPGGSKRLLDTRDFGAQLTDGYDNIIARPDWIPVGATALLCNLTTVNPAGSGYIQVWGNGQREPGSKDPSATNYDPARGVVEGRLCLIPITNDAFFIRATNANVHLIIDVQGYTEVQS